MQEAFFPDGISPGGILSGRHFSRKHFSMHLIIHTKCPNVVFEMINTLTDL